jgi:hypothetical protein
MGTDPKSMTCEELQRNLPELFESDTDVDLHEHPRSCELCRALIHDLYQIEQEARRQHYPSWVFRQKSPSR